MTARIINFTQNKNKMRKLFVFLTLAITAITSYGQGVYKWEDSLNLGAVVAIDTVLQPPLSQPQPATVGGFIWSCTVDAEGLNANTAKVELGGSNQFMVDDNLKAGYPQKRFYKFQPFSSTTFPYTLNRSTMVDTIRNGGLTDITYCVGFTGTNYYYDVPMIRFTKGTVSSGYVRYYWRFYKN
jgi:hypothetical protein